MDGVTVNPPVDTRIVFECKVRNFLGDHSGTDRVAVRD